MDDMISALEQELDEQLEAGQQAQYQELPGAATVQADEEAPAPDLDEHETFAPLQAGIDDDLGEFDDNDDLDDEEDFEDDFEDEDELDDELDHELDDALDEALEDELDEELDAELHQVSHADDDDAVDDPFEPGYEDDAWEDDRYDEDDHYDEDEQPDPADVLDDREQAAVSHEQAGRTDSAYMKPDLIEVEMIGQKSGRGQGQPAHRGNDDFEEDLDKDFEDDFDRLFVGDELDDDDILGVDDSQERRRDVDDYQDSDRQQAAGSATSRLMSWAGAKLSALGAGSSAAQRDEPPARSSRQSSAAATSQGRRKAQEAAPRLQPQEPVQQEEDILFDDGQDYPEDVYEQAPESRVEQQSLFQAEDDYEAAEYPAAEHQPRQRQSAERPTAERQPRQRREPEYEEAAASGRSAQNNNTAPDYNEVLIINVMSHPNAEFAGVDLLPVLLSCGLRFGDMNIFHRHVDDKGAGPVLFSVANIVNPGTFDLNQINHFHTRGLCFFLTLPNVINNMQAFDRMLDVAQRVRAELDGELKDDNRSVMTAQTVEHYRQRIRDFELRQMRQPH